MSVGSWTHLFWDDSITNKIDAEKKRQKDIEDLIISFRVQ